MLLAFFLLLSHLRYILRRDLLKAFGIYGVAWSGVLEIVMCFEHIIISPGASTGWEKENKGKGVIRSHVETAWVCGHQLALGLHQH